MSAARDTPDEPGTFLVVFVCTGNQARSALAEALYTSQIAGLHTRATSCGTSATPERPALRAAIDAGARLGVDLTTHRSQALSQVDLASADLVLGFEPFHLAIAVIDGGARAERTFLLGELVGLLGNQATNTGSPEQAREAVLVADSRRVRSRPDESAAVLDPLGKEDSYMGAVAARIDQLVGQLVTALFGRDIPSLDTTTP